MMSATNATDLHACQLSARLLDVHTAFPDAPTDVFCYMLGRSPPSRSIGSTAEAGAGEESGDPHERDCEGRVKLSTVPPTTHTKLQTMDLTEKEINDEIRTAGGNVGHRVANRAVCCVV